MSKEQKTHSNKNNKNNDYYDVQGGYNPTQLTEHYTVKGFEGYYDFRK